MIKVVCYTYLAATTIFLNVIERKYKRQIFPPDPIILGHVSICHLVWKLAIGLCGLVIQDVMDVSCSRYITYTEYNILAHSIRRQHGDHSLIMSSGGGTG